MRISYDKTDFASIFEYSKHLIEHTLRDFTPTANTRKGKGGFGQLVEELYFNYEPNNDANPDFKEAGLELKTTPLKMGTKQNYLIKERLVCGMINYCDDSGKRFEESHFYRKCLMMLILFYLHQAGVSSLDLRFIYSLLWKIPEKDLLIMKNDYKLIMSKIMNGDAQNISEGDTMYLGACRKGQKGDPLQEQPFSDTKAPKRAWCLKTPYMRTLLDFIQNSRSAAVSNVNLDLNPKTSGELVEIDFLKKYSFEDVVLNRFKPFYGKNFKDILKKFNVISTSSKAKNALAASLIASNGTCTQINASEEFVKAGMKMKTIRIQSNGKIKESMSFENIDYQEVYDCDEWTDSRLFELFSSRYFFVIFKETKKRLRVPSYKTETRRKTKTESEYVLADAFFWTMSQEDLAVAEEYRNNIRKQIISNHINDGEFWKISDGKCFHVRPKGKNSLDLTVNPITKEYTAKKLCYWFNSDYVENIVKKHSNII